MLAHDVDEAGEFGGLFAARGEDGQQRGGFDLGGLAGKDLAEHVAGLFARELRTVFGKRLEKGLQRIHISHMVLHWWSSTVNAKDTPPPPPPSAQRKNASLHAPRRPPPPSRHPRPPRPAVTTPHLCLRTNCTNTADKQANQSTTTTPDEDRVDCPSLRCCAYRSKDVSKTEMPRQ